MRPPLPFSHVQENEAAGDAPGTPDEKSFVDDDGTAYEWDPVARRFAEVGAARPAAAAAQAAAADAAFDQEQQTFSFEAEEIPAMPEAEASCPELPPLTHAMLWRQPWRCPQLLQVSITVAFVLGSHVPMRTLSSLAYVETGRCRFT